jgi:hypothetical protein
VDYFVVAALAVVAIAPFHPTTQSMDVLGSLVIAIYLLLSGLRMALSHSGDVRGLINRSQNYIWALVWLPIRKDTD